MRNPALFAGAVFVLGLLVGSFLNVVIYRLPIMLEREWRAQAASCCSRPGAAAAGGCLRPSASIE
jgi:leader peptidase (prepilin peptidase) / N-methyltransferase